MSTERRAHERYDLRLSAEITQDGRTFTAVTRDVSAGGCCVETAYRITESVQVDVALFMVVDGIEDASMPPLRVPSRVKWSTENPEAPAASRHMAGIEFDGATAEQKAWLENVLARIG